LVAASDRITIAFQLQAGQCHDATQGRLLFEDKRLDELAKWKTKYMAMDKGYEDDITRKAVKKRGFIPVVPPKSNRKKLWRYNKTIYKRRNEVERLFRRIKGVRRVCMRYEKLDIMHLAFLNLALIYDELRLC
jgi:transposase